VAGAATNSDDDGVRRVAFGHAWRIHRRRGRLDLSRTALIGSAFGGVTIVTLLYYGQVTSDS